MNLQLEPGEDFAITRQIEDPSDSNTYYIRAYVRNAKTDTLLATVDLEDKGDQRFRGTWHVAEDSSGQGYYITVLTRVFTDSGYTTESPLYGRVEELFLVQKRYNVSAYGYGMGGGPDISYKKIRDIIAEEVKKVPKPEKTELDLSSVLVSLERLNKSINTIKIPEPEKADFSSLLAEIRNISKEIKAIRMPELDLSPVIKTIEKLEEKHDISISEFTDYIEKVKVSLGLLVEVLQEKIEKVEGKIKGAQTIKRIREILNEEESILESEKKPKRKFYL